MIKEIYTRSENDKYYNDILEHANDIESILSTCSASAQVRLFTLNMRQDAAYDCDQSMLIHSHHCPDHKEWAV